MRDIVLMGLVLLVLPSALMHTTTAVMLWTWVSIMNPHRLAFGIAHSFPFAMVAAGCAAISLLLTKDPLKIPYKSPVKYLIFFLIWVCITTAMAFYPSESMVQLNKVLKIQLMTVVALAALHERKHIEMFAWVNALSIGFYGFKGGLFTISTGGGGRGAQARRAQFGRGPGDRQAHRRIGAACAPGGGSEQVGRGQLRGHHVQRGEHRRKCC